MYCEQFKTLCIYLGILAVHWLYVLMYTQESWMTFVLLFGKGMHV